MTGARAKTGHERVPVLAAVVLAAGAGSRFGRPKALAGSVEHPWVAVALATLRAAEIAEIVVVIGAEAEAVRRALPPDARVAENKEWLQGRTGSLQCGLRALSPGAGGALVHQVDFPEVRVGTVRALAGAFAARAGREAAIIVPVCAGRRGHPVVIGRAVWPEILALAPDEPLRTVVRRDPARVVEVAVDDPGIHRNRNAAEEEP